MSTLLIVGGAVLIVAGLLYGKIDNWHRDLTQNYATTDEHPADPRLKSLIIDGEPDSAANLIEHAAITIPRWQQTGRYAEGEGLRLTFVRTTPLLRFRDDITVHLEPHAKSTLVRAESQSRLGRADFGQNPRNLDELLTAVRSLPTSAAMPK